jgi:hypothetical protein
MIGKCRLAQEATLCDRIQYTHSSATVAWTPIWVSGLGWLIPMTSKDASVVNVFYRAGRFNFAIQAAETVANKTVVFYDTATDKVTNTSSATTHLLGIAVEAGSGTAGYVTVEVLHFPLSATISSGVFISPSHITVFEGTFAAGGTQTTETKLLTGCLSTDEVWMKVKTLGGDTSSVIRNTSIADGSISCTLNTPMGTGSPKISYHVDRASA